jgi:Tol biopolymer transport system component
MTRASTQLHLHRRLRPAAAATVGATIAVLAFAPLARATDPGKNGLIAFAADTGSGYQLYTVRPNGDDLSQVTHLPGDAIQPHWTPDGRRIVFELDHPQGEPLCSIEMINTDGSGLVDLTGVRNGCEATPSVTPDGQRIVFERYDDTTNVDAIWTMNLSGGDRHQITTGTGSGVTSPEVSPDGNTISFIDFNGQPIGSALFTITLHTDDLLQLTPFSSDVAVKQDWAPDGKRLVFTDNGDVAEPGESANIATIRPDGTDLHYLTHYQGGQLNAFVGSYSPDGHWIVFRLESHGSHGLYRMRPDGSALHGILGLSSFKPRFIAWGPRTDQTDGQR